MNAKKQTRTEVVPKSWLKEDPWWVESTAHFKYTIMIDGDYGTIIMVQRVKWLGAKYTVVNVLRTGLHIRPQMWILLPGWVWRRVKRMIESGEGREKVVNFIGSAMVSFVGLDGEYRKDFEEPHRLLPIFF
jgi:hypothetical protein